MKIAIIGSGISGLTCAYLLNNSHTITLYEKEDRLGGHAHSREIKIEDKTLHIDIGFIVFNYRNYPHLTAMFKELGVKTALSDMSFGVSIDKGWLEYGTPEPGKLFAQKRNLLRPEYLGMLRDILRFNKYARSYIDATDKTLGDILSELKMGQWFRQYFLLPMGGAIWSTPLDEMLKFPASTFIRFFDNHGLLSINDQPQWHTVHGGSRNYVEAIAKHIKGKYKVNCPVTKVTREKNLITVLDQQGQEEKYDRVIFACHSDQALQILDKPYAAERKILDAVKYQPNELILHTDESFMPKRRSAWTSWSYFSEERVDHTKNMSLTYWMNNLQPLETDKNIFVTLNPHKRPDNSAILYETVFEHPVFDKKAIDAQSNIPEIQSHDRIHFCGAWQRYGFHEDGCHSAVRVAKSLGVKAPWN